MNDSIRSAKKDIQLNNAGFSLIELLVAVAVGSIVLAALSALLTQSVKGFNSQTTLSRLQNDASITMSQIEQSVMEATTLQISKVAGAEGNEMIKLMTKDKPEDGQVVYIYDRSEGKIYLAASIMEDMGSLVCENVTSMDVSIMKDSVVTSGTDSAEIIQEIGENVRVHVTCTLTSSNKTRTVSKTIGIRNSIEEIKLGIKTGAGQSMVSAVSQRINDTDVIGYFK